MPVQDLNLQDLRQWALSYVGASEAQSFYGTRVDKWINYALIDLFGDFGVEDKIIGTCVPGYRFIPMPRGFMYEKMVLVNNIQLVYRANPNELDYLSQGTSLPDWYTHWGKPMTQLALGPMPPDSTYPLEIWFYRNPNMLLANADIPEVPPRFRPALAKKAAAEIILADGLVHLQAKADRLESEYKRLRDEFLGWYTDESKNAYTTPTMYMDY